MVIFHGTPQNNWRSLALVLTSVWKSCGKKRLSAGLTPRSEPLIDRFERKQQWQFVLSCGEVCRGHNGNQVASAFQEGFERWGLIPPQEPSPSPSATSAPRACTSSSGVRPAAVVVASGCSPTGCGSADPPRSEVLAGDADAAALPSLQLPLVNERLLLHADLSWFICTASGSATRSRGCLCHGT